MDDVKTLAIQVLEHEATATNLAQLLKQAQAALSAAEKERNEIKAEAERLKSSLAYAVMRDQEGEITRLIAERDTALRELADATDLIEISTADARGTEEELTTALKVLEAKLAEAEATRDKWYEQGNEFKEAWRAQREILTSIKTALGTPELPVEELAVKVGEVVKMAGSAFEAGQIGMKTEAVKVINRHDTETDAEAYLCGYVFASSVIKAILALPIHPKEGE